MKVRLFIRAHRACSRKAMRWRDDRRIEHETIAVAAGEDAFTKMIEPAGRNLALVIDVDGQVLADFSPGELQMFLEELLQPHTTGPLESLSYSVR